MDITLLLFRALLPNGEGLAESPQNLCIYATGGPSGKVQTDRAGPGVLSRINLPALVGAGAALTATCGVTGIRGP